MITKLKICTSSLVIKSEHKIKHPKRERRIKYKARTEMSPSSNLIHFFPSLSSILRTMASTRLRVFANWQLQNTIYTPVCSEDYYIKNNFLFNSAAYSATDVSPPVLLTQGTLFPIEIVSACSNVHPTNS